MFYLISNDIYLTENKINSLNILPDDTIVLFNHASPLRYDKIYNHKQKIIFLRLCDGDKNYWGLDNLINNNYYYNIYLINDSKLAISLKKYINNITIIDENIIITDTNYYYNKVPTTGFCAYIYLKNYLNIKDICLVNFNGGTSVIGKKTWSGHDYNFEQNYYKENNICML